MKQAFLDLYQRINAQHRELVAEMIALEHAIPALGSLAELADLAYVLRQSYDHHDEARKELDRISKKVAQIFYVLWASDPNAPETIKTQWCSCTPDPKIHASVPSPESDPERYKAVMKAVGIPEDIIATGLVRVGWKEFGELLTERQRAGLPLPEGIDPAKTFVEYKLGIRKRQDLPTRASGSEPQTYASLLVEGAESNGQEGTGNGDRNSGGSSGDGTGSAQQGHAQNDDVPF